jgi:hypothetical protein
MPYITVYSKIPSSQFFSNKSFMHSFIQLNHDIKQVYGFYNKAGITDGKQARFLMTAGALKQEIIRQKKTYM